jgi:7-keto-8-aminopelargonate synthetase-like enzyme
MASDAVVPGGAIDVRALTGSMFDYARPSGPDLLKRTGDFEEWRSRRSEYGVWPFSRVLRSAPGPDMEIADEQGHSRDGVSLACQDYLGLTRHPAIKEAAIKALHDLGPHSAGSPALAGNTLLSLELERELREALGYEHLVLFPTGWAAGYAGISGLVRPQDYVVMDQLSHACLHQGAFAATRNVRRHAHLDFDSVGTLLKEIRAEDTRNGIMVITEGLFSMDSDIPDIGKLQDTCREYNATLMVDVAHDFGSMGPRGGGSLGLQNLLGKVDLVMGSFSKTFSSNGGFIATKTEAVRQYMKFYGSPQTFSNALSPIQTAVIREALRIVRSPEGDTLRAAMLANAVTLRTGLEQRGVRCIGVPSAIVPAHVGDESVGRIAWSKSTSLGIHANIVEFPAVAVGAARYRLQMMPGHRKEQLDRAAVIVSEAIAEAKGIIEKMNIPKRQRKRIAVKSDDYAIGAKALPVFKPDDLTRLFENARIDFHPAGTTFVKAGANHGTLFVVRKGLVHIVVDHHGQEVTLAECGPGEIIGEISMLDGKGASASVVAETDVEVAAIDQKAITELARMDPDFGMRLYQSLAIVLAGRLRKQDIQILPVEWHG